MPRVAVIGGGPAGATAAAILARHGAEVVVLEKHRFPRHHIGESLQPAAIGLLERHLGLASAIAAQGFARKYGAFYVWGESREPWSVIFDPRLERALQHGIDEQGLLGGDWEMAWQVERSRFDELLLRTAAREGADVREGVEVAEVEAEGERVTGLVLKDGSTVAADWVLDASGQRCLLGARFGLAGLVADMRATATYAYYDGAGGVPGPLGRHVQYVYTVPDGWCWFIPIGPERTSVGVVTQRHKKLAPEELDAILAQTDFPLAGAAQVPRADGGFLYHARDWSFSNRRFVGDNWLLVGDAACFVDPILSGGVDFAVRTACRAALVMLRSVDGEPFAALAQEYERDFRREYQAYLRMARYWYGNNRSVDGLFWEAHEAIRPEATLTPLRAFVYLTTGGYAAEKHLKVFAEWQERALFERLGVDARALAAARRQRAALKASEDP
jgi:halogenation protein CepH